MSATRPPRLAEALLRLLLPPADREPALGDLEEERNAIGASSSPFRANIWYWTQVWRAIAPSLARRMSWRGPLVADVWREMALAWRSLRRRAGLMIAAVITLALGIGAATAIFSVTYAVLIEPLPYHEGGRLVQIWNTYDRWRGDDVLDVFWDHVALSYPEYQDLRSRQNSFDDVAIYASTPQTLTGGGDPDEVLVGLASSTLLPLLGVSPALGRGFAPNEEGPGAPRIALLSWETWQDRYGADRGVVGSSIFLSGLPYDVVGVLPAGFDLRSIDAPSLERPAAWIPVGALGEEMERGNHSYEGLGLLRRGTTIEPAEAETAQILRAGADPAERGARLAFRKAEQAGGVARPLLLLTAAASALMLIACGNFATLLLGDASRRRRELATRAALGAGRSRIVRQLAVEGGLLGILGGGGGSLMAYWGVSLLPALSPELVARTDGVFGATALAFAFLLGVGAGVGLGLLSGTIAGQWSLRQDLSLKARRETSRDRRTQHFLLATQLSISLMLLVAGALLIRTTLALRGIDPGFAAADLVTASVSLPPAYSRSEATQFFLDATQGLSGIPGVEAATAVSAMPFSGRGRSSSFEIVGRETNPGEPAPQGQRRAVMPNYHEVLRIPLVAGRRFLASDRIEEAPVVIVNETLARRYWPGGDAVGARIFRDGREWEVVGVVGDVLITDLSQRAQPIFYVPFEVAEDRQEMSLVVRSSLPLEEIADPIRRTIWQLDSNLPVEEISAARTLIDTSTRDERFRSTLVGAFALAATLLCATGLFGATTRVVTARRRELGIRLALGARPMGLVRRLALEEGRTLLLGLLAGGAGAAVVGAVLASFLFGVGRWDPTAFGAAVSLLVITAMTATVLAAWRGVRLDPVSAINTE